MLQTPWVFFKACTSGELLQNQRLCFFKVHILGTPTEERNQTLWVWGPRTALLVRSPGGSQTCGNLSIKRLYDPTPTCCSILPVHIGQNLIALNPKNHCKNPWATRQNTLFRILFHEHIFTRHFLHVRHYSWDISVKRDKNVRLLLLHSSVWVQR